MVGIRKERGKNTTMEEWDYGIVIKGIDTEQGKCDTVGIYNNVGINKI